MALVETHVQSIREQLAGHSRRDAENTRWDAESPRRDPDNSQSTALHLDAVARKLETRVLEQVMPIKCRMTLVETNVQPSRELLATFKGSPALSPEARLWLHHAG